MAILKITKYQNTINLKLVNLATATGIHVVDVSCAINSLVSKKLIHKKLRPHGLEVSIIDRAHGLGDSTKPCLIDNMHGLGESTKPGLGESPKPALGESPKPGLGESPNAALINPKQLQLDADPFRFYIEYYRFILERSLLPYPLARFIAKNFCESGYSKQYLREFITKFKYNLKCARANQRELISACYDLSKADFLDQVENLKKLENTLLNTIKENKKKYSKNDKEGFYYIMGSIGFMINEFEVGKESLLRGDRKITLFPKTKIFLERIFNNRSFPQRGSRNVENFFFAYYLNNPDMVNRSMLETLTFLAFKNRSNAKDFKAISEHLRPSESE